MRTKNIEYKVAKLIRRISEDEDLKEAWEPFANYEDIPKEEYDTQLKNFQQKQSERYREEKDKFIEYIPKEGGIKIHDQMERSRGKITFLYSGTYILFTPWYKETSEVGGYHTGYSIKIASENQIEPVLFEFINLLYKKGQVLEMEGPKKFEQGDK